MFKYFLYKIGQFLVNHLPLPRAYQFAKFISDLQYFCSPRDRKAVRNNLKRILSDHTQLKEKTREVFHNFGVYLVEFFRMERFMTQEYIKEAVTVENIEALDNALKHEKGVIILTAHMGNWEMGAAMLSMLGYDLTAVALPHKQRPVNDLFNHQREVKGIQVVPIYNAVRKCLDSLRKGKCVALVGDRDFTYNGLTTEFLGCKSNIPKGPAIFAFKTGAPIVPTFFIREGENKFRLIIADPIFAPEVTDEQVKEDSLKKLIGEYISVIEKYVLKFPTQWLMFRDYRVL